MGRGELAGRRGLALAFGRQGLSRRIEEYARYVGHADLIREAIDGLVGEDPPGPVYPYQPPATSAGYVPRGG